MTMGALLLTLVLAAEPVKIPPAVDLKNDKDPVTGKKAAALQTRFETAESAAKFAKEPAKHCGKLGVKLLEKEKVVDLQNAKCPVTGGKVDGKTFADKDGVRFRLSSPEAKKKFDAAKACAALGYGYVPSVIDLRNTECPITGDPCYPEAPIWVDLDGIRVRVCCDHCVKEAKEFKKRIFQALMVDPEKLKKKFE
jgi:hypothetical protein